MKHWVDTFIFAIPASLRMYISMQCVSMKFSAELLLVVVFTRILIER